MSEAFPFNSHGKIIVFGAKQIRRVWLDGEWFFSVGDIIGALTDSDNPSDYWYRMKRREKESSGIEFSTLCRQLKLRFSDGKTYKTDCVNTAIAFRIIQSIPSPKAESFKQWLAKVGYERGQEIENPELAQQRMRELYQQKGYPPDWIEKRVRGIAVRDELTDEWKYREVLGQNEFAILTAEIAKATQFHATLKIPVHHRHFTDLHIQTNRKMDTKNAKLLLLRPISKRLGRCLACIFMTCFSFV